MEHSYWLAGITRKPYVEMRKRNGGISNIYKKRNFFLGQNGRMSAMLAKKEAKKFHQVLNDTKLPDAPIFIIGHWRTGSTYLHQLLNLDNQLAAPTLFNVAQPHNFLVSQKALEPKMTKLIKPKRPMDNVALGFNEPQEDEYAILKLTDVSPLEHVVFPKKDEYFLNDYNDFIPQQEQNLVDAISLFTKKLSVYYEGKTIVFKNPFHSMRLPLLKKLFPNAKYIHIYRDPMLVVPSTINMWNICAAENALQEGWKSPQVKDVAQFYMKMEEYIAKECKDIEKDKYCQVKFEEFEKDPKANIKAIYKQLGIEYSTTFEKEMDAFIASLKNYQKNNYTLAEEDKKTITEVCKNFIKEQSY